MPALVFDQVSKSFGDTRVVDGFSAAIADQEFLVLLGPSGCGKSTMLRMIAGLIDITDGEISFDGVRVNDQGPKERNIAFVFQSYALYPHMSVRANIAFPLLMARFRWWQHLPLVGRFAQRRAMADPALRTRVEQIAELMELTPYLDRRPRTLSGGQRQRVALARALIREPSIYLLDEPLSNLDAKLRAQMRVEIASLYRRVRKTFVYVTHDQVEAMTMGTRIIVMDQGRIQQDGTPKQVYDAPANTFVARFIGSPPMNLFPVALGAGGVEVPGVGAVDGLTPPPGEGGPDGVTLGVRAERITVTLDGPGLPARVAAVEQLGGETVIGFRFGPEESELGHLPTAARHLHYAKMPGEVELPLDGPCRVAIDPVGVSWFDTRTGDRLGHPISAAAVGAGTASRPAAAASAGPAA